MARMRIWLEVLASAVVALPVLYMPSKAALENEDRDLEDISKTLGANRLQVFWHVSLPLTRRGLVSGLILAFARPMGEFGATVMVFGDMTCVYHPSGSRQ